MHPLALAHMPTSILASLRTDRGEREHNATRPDNNGCLSRAGAGVRRSNGS